MRSRKLRPKPTLTPATRPATQASTKEAATKRAAKAPDEPTPEPIEPLKVSGIHQVGAAIGGIMVGIEQQVFGRQPPAEILVRHAEPTTGLTDDGQTVTLDFPERALPDPHPAPRRQKKR